MRSLLLWSVLAGCLAAQNTLIVGHKGADSVGFYDAGTGKLLATVPVGVRPHEMTMARNGKHVFVSNYGVGTWTQTEKGQNTLSIVDVEARKEIGRVDLGDHFRPHGIETGHKTGNIYITTDLPPSVLVVDPAKRTVLKSIAVEGQKAPHMLAVSDDEKRVYTANSGSGTVSVLTLDGSARPVHVDVGGVPMGIALIDGHCMVTTRTTNQVVAIDTRTNRIAYRLEIAGQPSRLRQMGKHLLVTLMQSGETVVVDLKTRKELRRLKSGAASEGIQLDQAGPYFYVAAQGVNKVTKFHSTSWEKVLEIPTANQPDPMVLY